MTLTAVPPDCLPKELDTLKIWASDDAPDRELALRARIVTLALAGEETVGIAMSVLAARSTVERWRDAFAASGTEGLLAALPKGRADAARELAANAPGRSLETPAPGGLQAGSGGLPGVLAETGAVPRDKVPEGAPEVRHADEPATSGGPGDGPTLTEGPADGPTLTEGPADGPATADGPDSGGTTDADGTDGEPRTHQPVQENVSPSAVEAVVRLVSGPPPDGARQWTGSRVARELGLSPSTVSRAFRAAGIAPSRFWGMGAALASRSREDMDELERMAEGRAPTPEISRRAGTVMAILLGDSMREAGVRFGMTVGMAKTWFRAFAKLGPGGLGQATKATRPESPAVARARPLVRALAAGPPPDGRERWTKRLMADELGTTVWNVHSALLAEGLRLGPPNSVDIILAERSGEELAELERMAEGHAPTPDIAARAGAVAAILDGGTAAEAGLRFGMAEEQVLRWTRSFARLGPDGLSRMAPDESPSVLKARPLARALALSPPPEGRARWTPGLIAEQLGMSRATVDRALEEEGIRLGPETVAARIMDVRNAEDMAELERMAQGLAPTPEIASRAAAVAAVLDGETPARAGARFGLPPSEAGRWARSFARGGPDGLVRMAPSDGPVVQETRALVRSVLSGPPPAGCKIWTAPLVAERLGVSRATVNAALDAEGIRLATDGAADRILAARSDEDLRELERMAQGVGAAPEVAARAAAVIALLDGETRSSVAARFGMRPSMFSHWARSFAVLGPVGLVNMAPHDAPAVREARAPIRELAAGPPPEGRDRWTQALIAEKLGLSPWTVKKAVEAEGICLVPDRPADAILAARSEEDIAELKRMASGEASPKVAARAGAVLAVLEGETLSAAGRRFGMSHAPVSEWARSFAKLGPEGLMRKAPSDSPSARNARQLVRDLDYVPPPEGHDHWTPTLAARETGVSRTAVSKALAAEGIRLSPQTALEMIRASRSWEDLDWLGRMAAGGAPSPEIAARAGAVAAVVDGEPLAAAGKPFGMTRAEVFGWATSFARLGPDGLERMSKHEGPAVLEARRQLRALANSPPPEGASRWTADLLARELGLSPSTVLTALAAEGIRLARPVAARGTLAARNDGDLAELLQMADGAPPTSDIGKRAGSVAAFLGGESLAAAASSFGMTPSEVARWAGTFAALGPESLSRRTPDACLGYQDARPLVKALALCPPPAGHDGWTASLVASELGLDYQKIRKALAAEGIRLAGGRAGDRILAERSAEELAELRHMAEGHAPSPEIAARASAVAAVVAGEDMTSAGRRSGLSRDLAKLWTRSFALAGPDGLARLASDDPAVLETHRRVRQLVDGPPPDGAARWTLPAIAGRLGMSRTGVSTALAAEGIRLDPESHVDRILAGRSGEDLAELGRMARGRAPSPQIVSRAQAVEAVLGGESVSSVAGRFGMKQNQVYYLSSSFARLGPEGLILGSRPASARKPRPDGGDSG
jgi:transposase